jgi:simple sugar transport system permease protein
LASSEIAILLVLGLQQSVTIALAAQGELLSEKSGVMNIGIEGTMLMSAFVAAYMNWLLRPTFGLSTPYVALLLGMVTGMLINFVLSFISTKLYVDQVIAGIGINVLAGGITILALIHIFDVHDQTPPAITLPSVFTIPGLGTSGQVSPLEIFAFVLPVLTYLLFSRTKFGLRVRAVGENPKAAETAGLNVVRTRIMATTLGGAMLGMSGSYLSIVLNPFFVKSMTGGLGFIALGAVIAGAWSSLLVFGFSLLFGVTFGVYIEFGGMHGYVYLLAALPYLVTVIAMASTTKRLRPPTALGVAYKKE